ncbi:unnamed protein product, partial [Iphiclides podalirius]
MWAPATRMFLNTEQIESVVQVPATTPSCVSSGPEYAFEEVGEQQAPTIPTEAERAGGDAPHPVRSLATICHCRRLRRMRPVASRQPGRP